LRLSPDQYAAGLDAGIHFMNFTLSGGRFVGMGVER